MAYEPTIRYDAAGYAHLTDAGAAKGVTVVWVPNARNSGGTYADDGIDYPWRLVYHEIQGGANAGVVGSHPYPPHIWYSADRRILFQTVPLSRSAFALYQASTAPYRTNKARAIQVELEGYSDFVANEPMRWLDNISEDVLIPVAQWVATQGGSLDILKLPSPWQVPGSAYTDAPQRFEPIVWAKWDGICTHANVPMGDDHWDTGAMDIWRISQHAAYLIAGLLEQETPTQKEDKPVPLYFLQHMIDGRAGTIFAIFEGGMYRDDYHWDEINTLITHMNIKLYPVGNAPAIGRKMP